MFNRSKSRRNNRTNPRLNGWENLETRKLMSADGLPGFDLPVFELPQIELPGDILAPIATDPLVGKWVHANAFTPGVTEIEITKNGDNYEIDAKGSCVPTDCDWGETDLYALGTSISDDSPDYAYGEWDHGFKETSVTVDIEDNGLSVRMYHVYKDGSGRENFYDEYFLNDNGKMYDVLKIQPYEDVGEVLLGGWVNEDVDTRGMTKLGVSIDGDGVEANGWGSCSPTDCDWGSTDVNLLGGSISDNTYEFATAKWDHGFSTTFLTSRLEDGELKVEKYTVFQDGSDRSNYHSEFDMWKVGDSNHDGHFDSADFVAAFIAGEYEDGIDGNSTWEEGDWNRDGDFDSSDFVEAFKCGGYEAPSLSGNRITRIHDAALVDLFGLETESDGDDDDDGLLRLRPKQLIGG